MLCLLRCHLGMYNCARSTQTRFAGYHCFSNPFFWVLLFWCNEVINCLMGAVKENNVLEMWSHSFSVKMYLFSIAGRDRWHSLFGLLPAVAGIAPLKNQGVKSNCMAAILLCVVLFLLVSLFVLDYQCYRVAQCKMHLLYWHRTNIGTREDLFIQIKYAVQTTF